MEQPKHKEAELFAQDHTARQQQSPRFWLQSLRITFHSLLKLVSFFKQSYKHLLSSFPMQHLRARGQNKALFFCYCRTGIYGR